MTRYLIIWGASEALRTLVSERHMERTSKAIACKSWPDCRHSFFFSSRRRHTRFDCDWSSDVCSSDLMWKSGIRNGRRATLATLLRLGRAGRTSAALALRRRFLRVRGDLEVHRQLVLVDRKSVV